MKEQKSLVFTATILALALVFITFSVVTGFAKSTKPITLEFVSFLPISNKVEYQYLKREFIDVVNARANGKLVIKVRGGPEVIRGFDLGMSVQKGVIDLALVPTSFFESLVPGSVSHGSHSEYTAPEEREKGIFEYMQGLYNKAGLYYLGRGEPTTPDYFYMFLNKRAEKPEDFAKLKLGGTPLFQGFYKELKASTTFLAIPEYHSAMERGVVDGLCSSIYVAHQFGLVEATKYIITPGFYISPVMIICNLKSWNEIPKDLQKIMTEAMSEFEIKFNSYESGERANALKAAQKIGVEILNLSPKVAKWYVKAASDGGWNYSKEKWGGIIPGIRKVVTK